MNILVVEDDDEKRANLSQFLQERFPGFSISHARSLQSGLRVIFDRPPDLVLLDMTMTNFDVTPQEEGGRPHAFAGKEILRQMRRRRLSIPAIVITYFDRFGDDEEFVTIGELERELSESFSNYVGTVRYRSNVDAWKARLETLISKAVGGATPHSEKDS